MYFYCMYIIHTQNHSSGGTHDLPPQVLEINPKHPIVVSLYECIDRTRSLPTTTTPTTTPTSVEGADGIPEAEVITTSTTSTTTPAVDEERLKEIEEMASAVAEQLYDNALIAAGLTEDPRAMLPRLNRILQAAIKK